jgi:transposase
MYIRAIRKNNGYSSKIYYTHKLMESVRTEKGPRQRTILNLGTLELDKDKWKDLANRIEEYVTGQKRLPPVDEEVDRLAKHYAKLLTQQQFAEKAEHKTQTPDFHSLDVNEVSSSEAKSIGPEHIGLAAMEHLGFFKLFKDLDFRPEQINLAALTIIGRLIHPGSENELKRYAEEESALDELLGTSFARIGQNHLYEISDLLLAHKSAIEQFLSSNTRKILGLSESIILYDLTNFHFEGNVWECDKAEHGQNKQKRNDRPQITVGLVIDKQGFPKRSHIYKGNISEPSTLMEMVQEMHGRPQGGQQPLPVDKPTVVLDAGIATQDNLEALTKQGFSYIVVSRSRPKELPDQEFAEIKPGIKAQCFQRGNELFLHCLSEAKSEKEQSMLQKSRQRMEQELEKLRAGLSIKGRLKGYDRVLQRIGKLRKIYSRISKGFEIHVQQEGKNAVDITWSFDETRLSKPYDGTYFLRTDRTDLDSESIWQIYSMLTTVEDSFKCLKSELGLRPNFHQKAGRIEGHVFITVLAYHLLQWIRYNLNQAGLNHRWSTIHSRLTTHRVLTTSLPREDGGVVHMRHCTTATFRQAEIYSAMGISSVPLKQRKTITQ